MSAIDDEIGTIVSQRLGLDPRDLIAHLQTMKATTFAELQRIKSDHPDWRLVPDARHITWAKLKNLFDRTQFQVHILRKLADTDWYRTTVANETQLSRPYKTNMALELENAAKHGFGMGMFILTERCLRVFLRALDPVACRGATASFDAVYNSLLGSRHLNMPDKSRAGLIELLDMMRFTRNLIHNDGVYFGLNGADRILAYRGMEYCFRHAAPARFVSWQLLLTMAGDAEQMLIEVMSHPKIAAIPIIRDPYHSSTQQPVGDD